MPKRMHAVFWVLSLLALPAFAAAESPGGHPAGPPAEAAVETAPIVLDGKVLFRVRGATAYPAEARAKAISDRIGALARDESVSPDAFRVVESSDQSAIRAGDRPVVIVTDADARQESMTRPMAAHWYLVSITTAVKAYRRDRSPEVLLEHSLFALGATAVLVAFLLGLRWAFRRLDVRIERRLKATLQGLQAASRQFLRAEQLWGGLRGALRTVRLVLALAAVSVYLERVLNLFPWTRPFSERMLSLFLEPLSSMGRSFLTSIPDFAFLAILAMVTRFLLRSIRPFFSAVERGTVALSGFEPEWAVPTFKILRVTIIAFAVVVAYPYIPGSSSEAFKGVSIFLGVVMSLGATSIISNAVAGYSMTYRRAFRVGDRIKIDAYVGDVVEIRNLVTHLRTPKNEEVVLPNSVILNSHVVNYTAHAKTQGLILHTVVGIGYETPWRQVEAMLLLAAGRTPGLLGDPAPFVLVQSLGDFAVAYELNVYCRDAAAMQELYSVLHRNILDVFNEYGVQIMTPAYRADTPQPKVVPRDQWFTPPARETPDGRPA